MTTDTPPAWAEAILRWTLPVRDRETVTGDLVEEYRDSVLVARGRRGADRWYGRQVAGFVVRAYAPFGVALAVAIVLRDFFDWFAPPNDFYPRSLMTTWFALALYTIAGFWAAWRTRSLASSLIAAVTIAVVATLLESIVNGAFLAVKHDAQTLEAIRRSGGIEEAFTIPLITLVPGAVASTIGAVAAIVLRTTTRPLFLSS